MAGHSHWANIKRTKGAADAKRGALFSKLAKEIAVAARLGGGDPNFNNRLRSSINTAKSQNMPIDSIERAIKKGIGELGGEAIEEITYEGYGPGGVAFLVEATTDNRNRSAAEIRSIFSKAGGNLGSSGSVAWMFKRKGYFVLNGTTEDAVLEATLDAGADDVKMSDNVVEVFCQVEKYSLVEKAIEAAGFKTEVAKIACFAENTTPVADEDTARKTLALIEKLDDHDDVLNVYSNDDITDDILQKLEA